jgi:hypothetical protein
MRREQPHEHGGRRGGYHPADRPRFRRGLTDTARRVIKRISKAHLLSETTSYDVAITMRQSLALGDLPMATLATERLLELAVGWCKLTPTTNPPK